MPLMQLRDITPWIEQVNNRFTDKIDAFTASSIEIGKKELVIGRSYKQNVLKTLNYSGSNI